MAIEFKNPFAKDDDEALKDALRNDPDFDITDMPRKRRRRSEDEAPKDDAPTRTRKQPSMAEQIGIFVGDINGLLLMVPWTHDDALTAIEETHLVKSWDSAQKVDKRLRGWTEKITTTGGRVGLIGCVLGIIAARLIKHGVIPMPPLTPAQQAMMAEQAAQMEYAQRAREQAYTAPDLNGVTGVPYAGSGNPYVEKPDEEPRRVTYVTPDGMAYRTHVE